MKTPVTAVLWWCASRRLAFSSSKKMAAEHEEWLNTMFAGFGQPEQENLYRLLGHMG